MKDFEAYLLWFILGLLIGAILVRCALTPPVLPVEDGRAVQEQTT